MIAPYAWRECTAFALVGGGITFAVAWWLGWWGVIPALLTLALLAFYRDPPRRIPDSRGILLAPADGRIMLADADTDAPDETGRVLRVVIFLSVLDVHVNRSPCTGRVTAIEYEPGKFLNALSPTATAQNERNTLTLQPASSDIPGPVRVRQIAGLLARRIVCAVNIGDSLTAGGRFGMIKLGSQTELRAPADGAWEILVRPGQRVRGGVTPLARRVKA